MKKNIFILCLTALSFTGYTQEVSWFQAEQSMYYEIKGYTPGCDVQFYSNQGGGKMIRLAKTNNEGYLLVQENEKFNPAFALNKANKMVQFFGAKEFAFTHPDVKETDGNITITWQAETNLGEDIYFEIMKSTDGTHYTSFKKLNAGKNTGSLPYAVSDKADDKALLYKINVMNSKKGLRYTSSLPALQEGDVKIYPTIAVGNINVLIPQGNLNAPYKIMNAEGRVVGSGVLNNLITSLPVGHLASGNYYVIIQSPSGKTTAKFIKQ
ncbi:T9SS type A sorting domain-containing protein [Chitinophagaceae bacterium MMS25-I14]